MASGSSPAPTKQRREGNGSKDEMCRASHLQSSASRLRRKVLMAVREAGLANDRFQVPEGVLTMVGMRPEKRSSAALYRNCTERGVCGSEAKHRIARKSA